MNKELWNTNSYLTLMLKPFSYIYYFFHKLLKILIFNKDCKIPIICVGNVTLGGAGKTPTVIELRKILKNDFEKITVLTRGYKGKKKGPLIVKKNSTFHEVGEESILHSKFGLTCVSKNKFKGALMCKRIGAKLIIMDDGLQSINVKKDFNILVIDGAFKFGNNNLIPAGPLREPVEECLKKCNAILIIGKKKIITELKEIPKEKIFWAEKKIKTHNIKNKRVFAFSALGNNKNFHNSLIKNGMKIIEKKAFLDHHIFSKNELIKIVNKAEEKKLTVVCTEKDYIKVPNEFKKKIFPIDLELKILEERKLKFKILQELLN